MPAISRFDEPYARLLRGFVEGGLPDGTRARVAQGDFSTEQLLRQSGGILLRFPAPHASMDDGWVYTVKVLPGRGARVAVRCEATLYRHVFDASDAASDLAASILATVAEQNRVFGAWVEGGGSVSRVERAELPDDPADTIHPDFQRWLNERYRSGGSLNDGPAAGWWASQPGDRRAIGAAIAAGAGGERQYRLGPDVAEALDPAHQAHVERLHTAGALVWAAAALMLMVGCAGFGWHGWRVYLVRSVPWETVADGLSVIGAGVWMVLGRELRRPGTRWLFRRNAAVGRGLLMGLAAFGMLPCVGPCCLGALPIGGWVVYLLLDARSPRVLKG